MWYYIFYSSTGWVLELFLGLSFIVYALELLPSNQKKIKEQHQREGKEYQELPPGCSYISLAISLLLFFVVFYSFYYCEPLNFKIEWFPTSGSMTLTNNEKFGFWTIKFTLDNEYSGQLKNVEPGGFELINIDNITANDGRPFPYKESRPREIYLMCKSNKGNIYETYLFFPTNSRGTLVATPNSQ